MKQISLTQGKFALVDDEDYEYLMQWKWHYTAKGYAARRRSKREGGKIVYMHAVIMLTPPGMTTDHKEMGVPDYGLNNQRYNLRICTNAQNLSNRGPQKNNTSGYKGVSRNGKNWSAEITISGKRIRKGGFKTPAEAALLYDEFAKNNLGEFAKLNF